MRTERLPLLALAMGLLLAGLWAGLVRLGWGWPPLAPSLPMAHGPLMVGGFLGTLIGLERAIALARRWAYAAPILAGAGAILAAAGLHPWGPLLITAGSLVLVAITLTIARIHLASHTVVLAVAAGCWLVGNLLWLGGFTIPQVVLWWAGFLTLTIAGERLELSRFLRPPRWAGALFVALVALLVMGMALAAVDYRAGTQLTGLGWLLLALWLWRFDIARRRVGAGGQARYMALCLLAGYFWLGAAGGMALAYGGVMAGPHYDALLHALFVGFVFSMIFAHALIIFPVVLGVALEYHPRFYLPLALLHASLALRIGGDLLPWWPGRLWGGLLTVVTLLLFLASTAASLRRHRTVAPAVPSRPVLRQP
ncbi:MAG TPA: hypothetical protein VNK95_24585 [Caldilineaceae bacterium]|nr:hypothetical protein [Caldilineaceae bacterium]